ncbi:unnamed protein product [Protopolystoma xenopodis]|uniref:Uncharacterized protein n=1 Tax=Protopolystoma xenopodis TaxID=117903 RepID=A0A3S5AKJ0_9PLAT|nr:unnamed protein product [Protopolystoma xenopodis]
MALPEPEVPRGKENANLRSGRLRRQIPTQDRNPHMVLRGLYSEKSLPGQNLESEAKEALRFQQARNKRDLGIGRVGRVTLNDGQHGLDL